MSMMAVYGAQHPQDALREREEKLAAAHAETALLTERLGNPADAGGNSAGNHGNHGLKMVDCHGFDMI